MDQTNPEKRMWRTLFRIVGVQDQVVALVLPARNSDEIIYAGAAQFPTELRRQFKEDFRFFGTANIGCELAADLKFSDFEFAPATGGGEETTAR